jgi:putative oxidoreductase
MTASHNVHLVAYTSTVWQYVLLAVRVYIGLTIAAHGYGKFFRGGKIAGTAGWMDQIGMRPGKINAFMAATTEIGAGLLLVVGLLTPLACAAVVSLMVVAIVTVHGRNGFFIFNPGQGIEYCLTLAVFALIPSTFTRLDTYSIDHHLSSLHWFARPSHAVATTLVVGLGGALLQLVACYRPSRAAK